MDQKLTTKVLMSAVFTMQRDFYKAEAENLDHPHVSREVGQPPLSKVASADI